MLGAAQGALSVQGPHAVILIVLSLGCLSAELGPHQEVHASAALPWAARPSRADAARLLGKFSKVLNILRKRWLQGPGRALRSHKV